MKERIEYNLKAVEVDRRIRQTAEAVKLDETVLAFYLKEMKERKLYNEFGFSSTAHYAYTVCGFSDKKTRYLVFIGEKLERFRKIRESFVEGRIGWTKVRELLKIVTPDTEKELLELAVKVTNRKLEALVALKKEERAARKRAALARARIAVDRSVSETVTGSFNSPNGGLAPGAKDRITQAASDGYGDLRQDTAVPGLDHVVQKGVVQEEEPKLGVTLNFTPEEHVLFTRFLVEWRKRNPGVRKREEVIIRFAREYMDSFSPGKNDAEFCGGGDMDESRVMITESPYEVVVQHCPECERAGIMTERGEIAVGKPLLEQALCDGVVYESTGKAPAGNNGASSEPVGKALAGSNGGSMEAASVGAEKEAVCVNTGKDALPGRKRKAVTPALRKRIILRDRGRCSTPGCPHTKYLEIHHLIPQSRGGTNDPSNLTTVCGRCHKNIHLGKLKLRGTYPDIEFFHGAPGGTETQFGKIFSTTQSGETERVKEGTPVWILSGSAAA